MRLREFFLTELGGKTFKASSELGRDVPDQATGGEAMGMPPEEREVSRLDTLPEDVATNLQEIQRACTELLQKEEGDPSLNKIIHKFLLDLNGWMAETE